MINDIKIIDNFLPSIIQDKLEDLCYEVPFYLSKESVENNNQQNLFTDKEQFVFHFWDNRHINDTISDLGQFGHYFLLPLQIAGIRENFTFNLTQNLTRAKVNLTYNNNSNSPQIKPPHRDYIDAPDEILSRMLVAIYYVNDSDGDTIIYNEKEKFEDLSKYTIKERISPKKGRIVLFSGEWVHSASIPSYNHPKRIIINYNVCF